MSEPKTNPTSLPFRPDLSLIGYMFRSRSEEEVRAIFEEPDDPPPDDDGAEQAPENPT